MQEPFQKPLEIIHKLEQNGFQAYFVGGAVRDLILQRLIGDVDIATSAKPENVIEIFPKTIDVGAEHGTVIVLLEGTPYEVTTFRFDSEYIDYRRPKEVTFISDLKEDLKRRDFTINAIAMNKHGEILDHFHGREDINRRVIRTVGQAYDRFQEDALRMMRAIRFVSQLSFSLSADTYNAIVENGKLLTNISIERIAIEFMKLLKGQNAEEAMNILFTSKLYQYLPGLLHKEKYLATFPLYNLSFLEKESEYWTLLLFHIHEMENASNFLRMWKLPNKLIKAVVTNLEGLKKRIDSEKEDWTPVELYQVGLENAVQIERVHRILRNESPFEFIKGLHVLHDQLPIQSRKEMSVNGHDILNWTGKKKGPWLKSCLAQIESLIVAKQLQNNQEAIREWLQSCNLK